MMFTHYITFHDTMENGVIESLELGFSKAYALDQLKDKYVSVDGDTVPTWNLTNEEYLSIYTPGDLGLAKFYCGWGDDCFSARSGGGSLRYSDTDKWDAKTSVSSAFMTDDKFASFHAGEYFVILDVHIYKNTILRVEGEFDLTAHRQRTRTPLKFSNCSFKAFINYQPLGGE